MEITRTVIIELTPEELKEIIKDYLSNEGFEVNNKNINFKTESLYKGQYPNEYKVEEFAGCKVVCKLKTER